MTEWDAASAAWGAAAASLMSAWWSRPTRQQVEDWADLDAIARPVAESLGLGPELPGDREDPAALADEYERLFVGPGHTPCPPYESVWREDVRRFDRGVLLGPAAVAAEELYMQIDLRIRPSAHELPDHIAVEWEAAAYALDEARSPQVAGRLLDEHLRVWTPAFCRAVAQETHSGFYRTLADLTPRWAQRLSDLVATAVPAEV